MLTGVLTAAGTPGRPGRGKDTGDQGVAGDEAGGEGRAVRVKESGERFCQIQARTPQGAGDDGTLGSPTFSGYVWLRIGRREVSREMLEEPISEAVA